MTRTTTSIGSIALFSILALALAIPPSASAQSAGRAPVRGGEIQGLELGLEGALRTTRGGTLRWLLAAYEVIGTSELRPAADCEIQLTTSLDPSAAPTVVRTDANGRAQVEIAIPDDAPGAFGAVLRASSRGVARRFELGVSVDDARSLFLRTARQQVPRGGVVHVLGRLVDSTTGVPIGDEEVELTARDEQSRPVAARVTVRTDASGLFAHRFPMRREVQGTVVVDAEVHHDERFVHASAHTAVGDPESPRLIVAVAPGERVVMPGARVAVDVVVRTAEGRPVPRARVEIGPMRHDDPSRLGETDARGHARMTFPIPEIGAPWGEQPIQVSVAHEALGEGWGSALVRIAQVDWAAAIAVEGGALVPEIGGRAYVRVVGIDGHAAAAGVPVRLSGPRITGGEQTAATDASGIATFDVRLGPSSADPTSRCGGDAQAAATIRIGDGARAHTMESCLPLDPDGTARIRAASSRVRTGQSIRLELARAPSIARAPIVLSLLSIGDGAPSAIAMRIVAPGESTVDVAIPADAAGPILIRARPLVAGGREARGGSALLFAEPGDPIALGAALDATGIRIDRRGGDGASAWSIALPLDEASTLAALLRQDVHGPLAPLRVDPATATDALLAGALSAATPLDAAAPWILRGAQTIAVPAPEDPIAAALLRDPWRAQSRFVTGRLALVFQAIERHVAASVPEHIDDVAVQTNGRWDFNAQILQAVAESGDLGGEGATGLGGEPLTIEALRRFDPALTYDRVASRITRERLYRLLVALRRFVQSNAFDLPWARLGDPTTWLRHLPEIYADGVGQVQPRELVDAWGRPFVLRAVTGRARFASWAPLAGWELFSSGPDGRPGNGDDVADPTMRVLPSTSPYARAVGEDILLARLTGVELGRATVDLLGSITPVGVGGVPSQPEAAARQAGLQLWTDLPSELAIDPDPLALRRPARPGIGAGGVRTSLASESTRVPLERELDEEPREWGAVVVAFTPSGRGAIAQARTHLGSPLIVEGRLPPRLRVGEPVALDLQVTNASDRDRAITIAIEGGGPLTGEATPITLRAGTSQRVTITLRAQSTGDAHAEIRFLEANEAIRTLRWDVAIDRGMHPQRVRAASALHAEEWSASLPIASDAERLVARVVVVQPDALTRDPDLADARRRDPAIVAWAATLSSRPIEPELRADLLAMQQGDGHVEGTDASVSTACALVALSALAEDDRQAAEAAERARGALGSTWSAPDEEDANAAQMRTWTQTLVALAASGTPDPADDAESLVDPVARHATSLRTWIRRALRLHPEEPTLLARASAALLLADPRDAYGRAMYERASASLERVSSGGGMRVVPSARREGGIESISATLALALAAHQLGDGDLARQLVAGAMDRDHVIVRRNGEPLFWLLAAASYGVLGTGDAQGVEVVVAGRAHTVTFDEGVALVPIEGVRAGDRIDVRVRRTGGPSPIVRAEAVLDRPFRAADGDAIHLELAGDPGDALGVAAMELTIRARTLLARGAIVDLQLPAGVEADEGLLAALGGAGGVTRAERREPGFVRLSIGPLGEGVAIVVPIPIRWSVRGDLEGLGAIAHPVDRPEAMTVLAPRALSIAASEDLE